MRAIDADKLLRDIEKYHVSDGKFQHWVQIQHTIEPERKKGKWKCIGFMIMECSECSTQLHGLEGANFCPNCGADMRTERE